MIALYSPPAFGLTCADVRQLLDANVPESLVASTIANASPPLNAADVACLGADARVTEAVKTAAMVSAGVVGEPGAGPIASELSQADLGYGGVAWGADCEAVKAKWPGPFRSGEGVHPFGDDALNLWLPKVAGIGLGSWMGGDVSPFTFSDLFVNVGDFAGSSPHGVALCFMGRYAAYGFQVEPAAVPPTRAELTTKYGKAVRADDSTVRQARGGGDFSTWTLHSEWWRSALKQVAVVTVTGNSDATDAFSAMVFSRSPWVIYFAPTFLKDLRAKHDADAAAAKARQDQQDEDAKAKAHQQIE